MISLTSLLCKIFNSFSAMRFTNPVFETPEQITNIAATVMTAGLLKPEKTSFVVTSPVK